MYEWSEEHLLIRQTVRDFIDREVRPRREELEFGDTPPYEVIRKLYSTFGMDSMARDKFKRQLEKEAASGSEAETKQPTKRDDGGMSAAMQIIPIIELCRCSHGLVTALGVSVGLAAGTIM